MKRKHLLVAGMLGMMISAFCVGCGGGSDSPSTDDGGSDYVDMPEVAHKTDFGVASPSGTLTLTGGRVGVHDPSIEYDPTSGQFYIFGSHTDFAKSSDLIKWTKFSEGVGSQKKYGEIFAENAEWASRGSSNYNVNGNLWAPDVIYNKDMEKWCMYMSVNGDNYYSSIAMATADSIEGPYTYAGTVVYSGFATDEEVAQTDYEKVTGESSVDKRYLNAQGTWSNNYGTNAIDPCVLYDKDGRLWMVYGSWFGGLYMLRLDNETGLREYNYTYETEKDVSDEYLGKRVSGGYGGTGEGPYIVWDEEAGYYYMYVSYCGLNATDTFSGYHMRLFRSENIDGPYVDAAGNDALRKVGENQAFKGIKIMGNYCFSSLSTAGIASSGYMSPGHNSAIVDNEGNRYVIYHTRYNKGSEAHNVRVHQQFLSEDGWLVTAPYEYLGSKISETGYDESEIVGTYELINHGNTLPSGVIAPMLETLEIELNEDHTVTGDMTGTWSQKEGTYYATIESDGVTYKGVFFKQFDESEDHVETMTFSLIGSNNIALWGSRDKLGNVPDEGVAIGAYDFTDSSNLGKDSVGTVGDATVNGGMTTAEDADRGTVLAFDGVDDYLELPKTAVGYDGYTIMMWFKSDNTAAWERLFDIGDDMFSNMFMTTDNGSNKLKFSYQYDANGEKAIEGPRVLNNNWTHVAVTINSVTKKGIVYVNGEIIGKVALDGATEGFLGEESYIGKSRYAADPLYKGYMDDIYMFDYALSEEEVLEYMNK